MQRKHLLLFGVLAILAVFSVACGGSAAPVPTTSPTQVRTHAQPTAVTRPSSDSTFQPQTVEGGSVSVAVQPIDLQAGAPADFEIAMNTHSVDLSADMLQVVTLRDNTGQEYAPTKWDGPVGGGHHRSGKLEFPALAANVKSITLLVKNIAGIPERTFNWEVP